MTRRALIYLPFVFLFFPYCIFTARSQGGSLPAQPQVPSFRRPMTVSAASMLYNFIKPISGNDQLAGGYIGANTTKSGLTRFSIDGGIRWSILMTGKDKTTSVSAEVTAADEAQNGDIIVAGYHTAGKSSTVYHNYQDGYVARLNARGEPQWMKIIDRKKVTCATDNVFQPFLVSESPDGGIVMAAEVSSCQGPLTNLLLVKLDATGNMAWYASYNYNLNHAYRNGLFYINGRIVFWNFRYEGSKSGLELLQFNSGNGALEAVNDWQIAPTGNSNISILDGFMLKAKQLDNGNFQVCLTSGNKANNVFNGDVLTTPLNLFVLNFDKSFHFLDGYDILPATQEKGSVQMEFSSDGQGMVICDRLYLEKISSNLYVNAIGAFKDGQILHQRKFNNINASSDVPEPITFNSDGSFTYINIFGQYLDYYLLRLDDVSDGCLGNTPAGEELFVTKQVSCVDMSIDLPTRYADTVVVKSSEIAWEPIQYVKGNRLSLGPDQLICANGSLTLKATPGFRSYQWSNGAVTASMIVRSPGIYSCNAMDVCGVMYSDTIEVRQMESLHPLPTHDATICRLDSLSVSADPGFRKYLWKPSYNMVSSPGDRTLVVHPDHDTVYYLQADLYEGCSFSDSMVIKVKNSPSPYFGKDRTICNGDSLILRSDQNFSRYLWNTGASSPTITVTRPGRFVVMITNAEGCRAFDTVMVQPGSCGILFNMPNAFTPNGDGLNDLIRPILKGFPLNYHFHIYNRWGKLVYRSDTPGEGWDGRINGELQPGDSYIWQCTLQVNGSPPEFHKGTFTLIR